MLKYGFRPVKLPRLSSLEPRPSILTRYPIGQDIFPLMVVQKLLISTREVMHLHPIQEK